LKKASLTSTNSGWSVAGGLIRLSGSTAKLTLDQGSSLNQVSGTIQLVQNALLDVTGASSIALHSSSSLVTASGSSKLIFHQTCTLTQDTSAVFLISGSAQLILQPDSVWSLDTSTQTTASQNAEVFASDSTITASNGAGIDLVNSAIALLTNVTTTISSTSHWGVSNNASLSLDSNSQTYLSGGSLLIQGSSAVVPQLRVSHGSRVYALAGGGSFSTSGNSLSTFSAFSQLICDAGIVSQSSTSQLQFASDSDFIAVAAM